MKKWNVHLYVGAMGPEIKAKYQGARAFDGDTATDAVHAAVDWAGETAANLAGEPKRPQYVHLAVMDPNDLSKTAAEMQTVVDFPLDGL